MALWVHHFGFVLLMFRLLPDQMLLLDILMSLYPHVILALEAKLERIRRQKVHKVPRGLWFASIEVVTFVNRHLQELLSGLQDGLLPMKLFDFMTL